MKDDSSTTLFVIFLVTVLFCIGSVVGSFVTYREAEKDVIKSCSITGTHIIDENTIIVCQVLKIRQTETPVQDDKKPEISL